MRDESVARSYAETLIELAARQGEVELYGDWIHAVADMIAQSPRLKLFLETPRISAQSKKEALRTALGDDVPRTFLNFLLITIDKRRQRLLALIDSEYQKLLDARLGRERVDVIVARPLDEAGRVELTESLSRLLGKTAIPRIRVRPEIMGGVVVKSGDTIYDGSVRHRMERLRRHLMAAEIGADGALGHSA